MSILKERFYHQWKARELRKEGTSIDTLKLPDKITNRLRLATLDTIEELCEYTAKDLEDIKGLSKVDLEQIVQALKKQGQTLK